MASQAQIQANRSNAQKSTGPRSAEGKAAASQNALKHGLRAQQTVIQGEDPGEFEFYRDQMLAELSPAGAIESTLAERVVGLAWRLRRAERIQAEVFDALLARNAPSPLSKLARSLCPKDLQSHDDQADGDLALGHAVVKDFANTRVLDRLTMYERRIEHSLYKTIAELQRLRLLRSAGVAVLSEVEGSRLSPAQAPEEKSSPLRQTNPIAAGVLSVAERISPPATTDTPAQRPAMPAKAPSSLTIPAASTIIPPSATPEKVSRKVPVPPAPLQRARAGRERTLNSPHNGPGRGRGRQLEGLRRR